MFNVPDMIAMLEGVSPSLRESVYDFSRRPPSAEVDRQIKAYDGRLFLLWSRLHNRWELWRWKDSILPGRNPSSEDEIYNLARLQAYGVEPDMRLVANLSKADLTKVSPTLDPEKLADHIDQETKDDMARKMRASSSNVRDMVEDNAEILRRDISDAFSGYYPSMVNPPENGGRRREEDDH